MTEIGKNAVTAMLLSAVGEKASMKRVAGAAVLIGIGKGLKGVGRMIAAQADPMVGLENKRLDYAQIQSHSAAASMALQSMNQSANLDASLMGATTTGLFSAAKLFPGGFNAGMGGMNFGGDPFGGLGGGMQGGGMPNMFGQQPMMMMQAPPLPQESYLRQREEEKEEARSSKNKEEGSNQQSEIRKKLDGFSEEQLKMLSGLLDKVKSSSTEQKEDIDTKVAEAVAKAVQKKRPQEPA